MKRIAMASAELCPVQKGGDKALTIMDIIVDTIYHQCFIMLADEVGTGSPSQQVTPD